MPSTPIPITVTLTNRANTIDVGVNPPSARVGHGATAVHLVWTATGPGASFPATNFFRWKGAPAAPAVTRISATQLQSADYVNNGAGETWQYMVAISNGTITVNIDPEVDNQPPGGIPGPDDQDEGGGPGGEGEGHGGGGHGGGGHGGGGQHK